MGVYGGCTEAECSGFQTPLLSPTCEWFDPATATFSDAPFLSSSLGRAFFGTSFLPSGQLVVAGGLANGGLTPPPFGGAVASSDLLAFDGASWTTQHMTLETAYPVQATLPDGRVFVAGGFIGNLPVLAATAVALATDLQDCVHTDPFTVMCGSATASIGVQVGATSAPSPRGGHAMVELFDGSFLVVGGMHGSSTTPVGTWALADAFIYAP